VPEDAVPRKLVVGNRIRCPKDGILRNMLAYRTFEIVPEFADELNPVLKCPCGHLFSPGPDGAILRERLREAARQELADVA
jgi:hypothetical protein